MSWRYITWAWEKELPAREKWLLFALAYHASEEEAGACWPRVQTLVRDTGLSARTIQRALDELERRRIVYRWETVVEGEQRSNTYLLNVHDMGPTEWRNYCLGVGRRNGRGWVHRRNVDRRGDGNFPFAPETPPLFGNVADRKLQNERTLDTLTPPGRQDDTQRRQGDMGG